MSQLICLPVSEGWPGRDCVQHPCARCGTRVWISPTGQGYLADGTASLVVCVPCAQKKEHLELKDPTPAQLAEVEANTGQRLTVAEWRRQAVDVLWRRGPS